MYKIWPGWLLIPTLILAFWIRTYRLSTNPPELFSDEITQVLSAKSIIETGKDINGKTNLFLYNKIKLGTPIYGYLAALSTYILGNNTFAIRLPAAIAGTLSVLFIFLLSELLTQNNFTSILSAMVAAITPWGIYFSRIGWEPALTLPFLLLSIYLLLAWLKRKSRINLIFSFCLFGLSFYASDTLTLYSPLFLITILLINLKHVFRNYRSFIFPSFLFSLILIPFIYVSLTNPLKNDRAYKLSTFKTGVNISNIQVFTKNYIEHFSYNFLFKTGDPNLRHGTGRNGVLYVATLPFILIGVWEVLKDLKDKNNLLLLLWTVYFPLGGSLTNDGVPHATRTLVGLPIFILLFGLGVKVITEKIKRKRVTGIGLIILAFILSLSFFKFFNDYFYDYRVRSQSWWEYGQAEVYRKVRKNSDGQESLCLENIDYWHEETLNHYYLGYKYDYRILYDLSNPKCIQSNILVLAPSTPIPKNYQLIDTVLDLENRPKWNIYKSLNSYTE